MRHRLQSSPRRRALLASGALLASTFTGTLAWLYARQAAAAEGKRSGLAPSPYGPVSPVHDATTGLPLLQLPQGFSYRSFGWTGDRMSDGLLTPGRHDGMGVVASHDTPPGAAHVLVRNHERVLVATPTAAIQAPSMYSAGFVDGIITLRYGETPVRIGASGIVTNPYAEPPRPFRGHAGGGCSVLSFRDGAWETAHACLGGTLQNCSGGATPWGTWLSCEETTLDFSAIGGAKHGYVFEVDPGREPEHRQVAPIVEMGRFRHEAVAVDPATCIVYQSEDNRNMSAFYRYVPDDPSGAPGSLHQGGRLQAARVRAVLRQARPRTLEQTNDVGLLDPQMGDSYALEWVDIADPDAGPRVVVNQPGWLTMGIMAGPAHAAFTDGCARMSRCEGLWHAGGRLFIVDSSAGVDVRGRLGHGHGAIWELTLSSMQLRAVFVSADPVAANHPDGVTVSPRGGVLLCEDGGATQDEFGHGTRLLGLDREGRSYTFAKNNLDLTAAQLAAAGKPVEPGDHRSSEFVGVCFAPSGQTLFTSIQSPGITFAISGPWGQGGL